EVRRGGALQPPAAPAPAGATGHAVPLRRLQGGWHRRALPVPRPGLRRRPRPPPPMRAPALPAAAAAPAPVLPQVRLPLHGARAGRPRDALLQRVRPRRRRLRLPLPRLRLRPAPLLRHAPARPRRQRPRRQSRREAVPAPQGRGRVPPSWNGIGRSKGASAGGRGVYDGALVAGSGGYRVPVIRGAAKSSHASRGGSYWGMRKGKVKRCCEIAGFAAQVVISAVLGDPTALIAGVVGSLIAR
uniref:Uncharacterized protein n=1 Tax=Aegilops tauschii subsp. strangulata TaxID=200361 RepID=A0A453JSM1_AEGTS